MRSPALALTGQVWRRYRVGLAICAAVWLALSAVALAAPQVAWLPGPEDGPLRPAHFVFLFVSFMPVLAFVICAFAYNRDGPLEERESAFPRWTFTLPVRTSALVAWPMLQATAATAVAWVAWDATVLWPTGQGLPVVWPAVMLATVIAWLQAINWTPHPLSFLRVLTLLGAVGLIGLIPACGIAGDIPPAIWVPLLAALIPVAYGVALAGVTKARRGDTPAWTWPARLWQFIWAWLPGRGADFTSALEAQSWFEWRVRGMAIPFVVGILLVVWVPVFLMGPRAIRNLESPDSPTLTAVTQALTAPGVSVAGLLAILPLYMGMLGLDLGGVLYKGQWIDDARGGCHPFVGLRPLSDGEMVLAKMRMAARCTLVSWGLIVAIVGLTLGLTGAWREIAGAPVLNSLSGQQAYAGVAAAVVLLVAFTWLRLVAHLWIGLSGEPVLIRTVAIIVNTAWMPLAYAVWWLMQRPAGITALQALAVGAVAIKLMLALGLTIRLVRRRIATPRFVTASLAAWTMMAIGSVILISRVLPDDHVPLLAIVVGVMLLMPLNRLAAAPLVLAWNRHR
jgi:hypothetical protein